ncbi:MAG: hypothetical protein DRI69_09585 [Bacteroidetes bacterium]|nr:MAG: hypothetical protein DRI69_09585 [Bacteroidota bacterium]
MLSPDNSILIFTILLAASLLGIYGERLGWYKNISGVLVTIIVMALLATFGIIPSASDPNVEVPVYDFVFKYFVPLAIPLLLFKVQMGRIVRESGRLLIMFLIGSVGVVIGALIAWKLVDIGPETYKLAGVLIGTYTGGSVNFMAVASTLDFLESPHFPSTIAVDNVFTNFYLMGLFAIPSIGWIARRFVKWEEPEDFVPHEGESNTTYGLESIVWCLFIAFGLFAMASLLSPVLGKVLATNVDLTVLITTILTIVLANLFPVKMDAISDVAFDLGMFFLYVFLAVIGAASDIGTMLTASPGVIFFAAVILIVHFIISLTVGRLLGYSLEEILVTSCANAAGPSVAAPMAASFGMRSAVTPAILVAIMGYVVGTFLGVSVGLVLGP